MGWRRAFWKTVPKDPQEAIVPDKKQNHERSQTTTISPSPSPRGFSRLGIFSGGGGSNPSTPRLRCRTTTSPPPNQTGESLISPNLHCKTTTPRSTWTASSSPRSPFALLKNSLGLSRSHCGICLKSMNRGGQGMAIYTAECLHKFHFPCITSAIPRNPETLACPICKAPWKEVLFLGIQNSQPEIGTDKITEKQISNQFLQPPASISKIKTKYDGRNYGDDEPLKTPVAGARFVPIPEASDEDEEFKGFLNPVSTTSDEASVNSGESRSVMVSLMPEAAVVSVGRTEETYAVVLKVKAPPPPRQPAQDSKSAHLLHRPRRAPIDLVAVLDVSASMSGEKLQMMKRAMRLVVSSLGSADRLAIVAFSACPKRLLPLSRMTPQGQRAARRIVDRLACSQGCCVPEALRQAAKVLEDRRERNPVASIMLLSDGEDDPVPPQQLDERPRNVHVSTTRFAHVEIPVESAGYGYSNEPAEDAFKKCVGGLLSVVVQDLSIELGFSSGSDPAVISAVYSCSGRPTLLNSESIRIGDLYAEEERELLLELRVPVGTTIIAGSHHVLSVRSRYRDPATNEIIKGREQTLLVPRLVAVRSLNPKIGRLRCLFITTKAIAEARRVIQYNNNLASASQLLSSARALLAESGSAEEYVRGLDFELGEVQWRREYEVQMEQQMVIQKGRMEENGGEPLTPTRAWRAADELAKVAVMKKSTERVSDLHGFENARF